MTVSLGMERQQQSCWGWNANDRVVRDSSPMIVSLGMIRPNLAVTVRTADVSVDRIMMCNGD